MAHKDEIKGRVKEMEGEVQKGWGKMTNQPEHEAEGEMKKGEGKVKQGVGRVKEAVHDLID
jgi:uncharacterized protein YjbJ (UPF0337 family)